MHGLGSAVRLLLALLSVLLGSPVYADESTTTTMTAPSAGAIVLTDDNYQKLVTLSSDLWLLEFYAPWCGHCKKLRPVLDELALLQASSKFPMKIGVMDATRETTISGQFGIKSFPTIKFFKDSIYGKFEGPRTLEGFQKFAERMHGPAVTMFDSAEDRGASERRLLASSSNSVAFLYTYQEEELPPAFTRIAKQLQAEATFAAVRGTSSSFAKLELNKGTKYMTAPGSGDVVNVSDGVIAMLEDFVKHNNFPLVSQLDSHNFKQLGSLPGRTMAIAIVDYKDAAVTSKFIAELEAAASALPQKDADKFVFGHLDGVQWKVFTKTYDASVTSLLLLDLPKDAYHTTTINPSSLTSASFGRADLTSVLTSYLAGSSTMKKVPTKGFFSDIQKKLADYYPYSLLCFLPIVLVILSFVVQSPDDGVALAKKKD